MNVEEAKKFISDAWDQHICESLSDYIRVPNQSPMFDAEVLTNGLQEKAMGIMIDWIKAQEIPTLQMRIETCEGRTPLLFITIDGTDNVQETILCYSHMDKQPPMVGWPEEHGPYDPVIKNGKLYGRGGADDGYGIYSSITAIKANKLQGIPHGRFVILVEACEESGSKDLPYYIEKLTPEIGTPSLVICLDSGAGNYDQMWLTSTLRGLLYGVLTVEVSSEGVHSGSGSGIIPSSFRIIRDLLDRIEDSKTGKILVPELWVDIPSEHLKYAYNTGEVLGDTVFSEYPFLPGVQPMTKDRAECLLNRNWRPTVSYTGIGDIPPLQSAGNVLRPKTSIGLSFRLPPTCNADDAYKAVKKILEENPPYGAKVTFDSNKFAPGWKSPALAPWLDKAVEKASQAGFNKPYMVMGEGGSIPLLYQLGVLFPGTQFCVTGVLGPGSNAHGPNESLDIAMFKGITMAIASIVADHYQALVVEKQSNEPAAE